MKWDKSKGGRSHCIILNRECSKLSIHHRRIGKVVYHALCWKGYLLRTVVSVVGFSMVRAYYCS